MLVIKGLAASLIVASETQKAAVARQANGNVRGDIIVVCTMFARRRRAHHPLKRGVGCPARPLCWIHSLAGWAMITSLARAAGVTFRLLNLPCSTWPSTIVW